MGDGRIPVAGGGRAKGFTNLQVAGCDRWRRWVVESEVLVGGPDFIADLGDMDGCELVLGLVEGDDIAEANVVHGHERIADIKEGIQAQASSHLR